MSGFDKLAVEDAVIECEGDALLLGLAVDAVFAALPKERDGDRYVYRLTCAETRAITHANVHMITSVRALSKAFYGREADHL